MTSFDPKFFREFKPTDEQIQRYLENAENDLAIAQKDSFLEVRFTYAYQALIKAGIALIAKKGGVRVRSVPGHHVQILSKMGEVLSDPDIDAVGNAMRTKRNLDLYEGGTILSEKDVKEYVAFASKVLTRVRSVVIPSKRSL
jgi:hypothetical protein